jgi:hypothetical protein
MAPMTLFEATGVEPPPATVDKAVAAFGLPLFAAAIIREGHAAQEQEQAAATVERGDTITYPLGMLRLCPITLDGKQIGHIQYKHEKGSAPKVLTVTAFGHAKAREGQHPDWVAEEYRKHTQEA